MMSLANWTRVMAAGITILALASPTALAQDEKESEGEESWDVSSPPGDWQTITIDTEETTWSNLDVSPDGTTIAFDMLGDIYTVPIGGGEATALTDGIEWNIQPRYRPDGSKIVFVSDRDGADNLWLMNADGSDPKAISSEKEHLVHTPSWSPDGELIVAKKGFTSTRSIPAGEIWMFHVGGGGGLQLVERPFKERDQKLMIEPAFSIDGRYVYFTQDTTPGRTWQYNKDSTGQIFTIQRLDRETGKVEPYVTGPGGSIRPTPSPDGRYLAFVRRLQGLQSAIFLKDLESGQEWPIYDAYERDHQETTGNHGNTPSFAWTPDSRNIVFWTAGTYQRIDVESRELTAIPVHVRAEKKIRPAVRFAVDVAPESFSTKMLRWAQLSPDGKRAIFQSLGYIWATDVGGGEPKRLTRQTDHFEFYPSFSPDGRSIVYTTWDDQELGTVRVVSAKGGSGKVLSENPGHYVEPQFSADGERIVYRKLAGGYLLSPQWSMEPGIYVSSAKGGDATRVSNTGFNAQFNPDSDRVLFSDFVEETQMVLNSVDLEGDEERTHLKGKQVTEFRVSPDGKWVAFTEQYNAFVTPFAASGKTVDISGKMTSLPVKQVSKRSGEFLSWSADSSKLMWSNGPTLYTRDLTDAFGFLEGAPEELPEPVTEGIDLSFEVPTDVPEGQIAFTGARIITMRGGREGTQEVIENGIIVVDGNRITAVGTADEVQIPNGAFVVDAAGKTIIPGMIDAHAHGGMGRAEITPEQNWMQFSNLSFGVTTIHDPSNDTTEIFAASDMQRAGEIVAPRIYSTGTILYGAHVPGYTAEIGSLEDAVFHVQRLKDCGAISVKSYQQPRRDQRQQVIEAAAQLQMMVVPEGGAKYQHNMNEIVDGHTGIEHALSIKTGYDDVVQLWSQTEVGYTPTLGVAYGGLSGELFWYDRTNVWENERLMRYAPRFLVEPRAIRRPKAPDEHYNHVWVAGFAKELRDSGVSVQIGAHGQREGLAAHWEMWMMEQGGFTPWEAIRTATLDGAWYIGADGDIGSIEVGKLADLVVIDGNPLEDLRRSEYVDYTMINGRLFEAATMNQIGNETSERQAFFFELEGGDTVHASMLTWLDSFQRKHGCQH